MIEEWKKQVWEQIVELQSYTRLDDSHRSEGWGDNPWEQELKNTEDKLRRLLEQVQVVS